MTNINTSTTRKKLINAIVFFASNTKFCGKVKLFKLLYLMDFEHFSQTGKSVTGMEYQAWKLGPVPAELVQEWDEFGTDLEKAVHIELEKVYDHTRQSVKLNDGVNFDPDLFTPRQLKIMESIIAKFNDDYSETMVDITHEQNGAWDRIWQNGHGAFRPIPYALSIDDNNPDKDTLVEIGTQQYMYQTALIAARQAANQAPAEY